MKGEHISDFVIFDLETTGLSTDNDSVIEISALKVIDGAISEEFSTLVDPGIHIPYLASSVNGITDDMVVDAPTMEVALKDFITFAGNYDLVGHNIMNFDMKFIQRDTMRFFGRSLDNKIIDTLYLAKRYLPDLSCRSLESLADYYDVSYEGAHRALADCKINLQVYRFLLKEMDKAIKNVKDENKCPRCGNALIKRNGKHGEFWGCASYPICKYTKDC